MISVVLLSGGIGSRSGKNIPKQYSFLLGKRVITYCIDSIISAGLIDELVIVYGDGYLDLLHQIMEPYNNKFSRVKFVLGGASRQDSVFNGLVETSYETLILHESARPLITGENILSILNHQEDSVTMGASIPFTVLKHDDGLITGILNRDELFNVQLPQKFIRSELINAHKQAKIDGKSFTDDSSLLFAYGGRVAMIDGSLENIKITSPKDFPIAEDIINSRKG